MTRVEKLRIVLENKITSFLHKDRRRLMIRHSVNSFPFRNSHEFKLLYYPTGGSMADNPKHLPGSVIEKIRKILRFASIVPDLRVEYSHCYFTNKKYTYTTLYLGDKELNDLYDSLEDIL